MTVLPVRPAPRPSEPLSSYAVRLADANGIHRGRVLPRYRHDIDIPKPELDTLAALAGLDHGAARQLTMNRYPLVIRGHGIQRRHGWRLHFDVVWLCPACTLTTGHTDLLWQTALMPVCLRCRCYLVRAGAAHTLTAAHPRVLELAEILRDLAEDAIEQPRARGILYRLRRRCQVMADTIDPAVVDANPEIPKVDLATARTWGAYPSPDPCTVAALLVMCGRRLVRDKRQPPAHARLHQAAEFTPADQARLDWFLTRLRHHVTKDGLDPRHVPALLPLPVDDDSPVRRPGQWLSLTRAATALHMLITRANDCDPTPEESTSALGVTGIPTSLLIDGIHTGAGLRHQDADLLSRSLDALLAAGLVDYQRRRNALRAVTHLPTSATRLLPPSPTLTRLVTTARAPHRRLSHHLDTPRPGGARRSINLLAIPQVIPHGQYVEHLAGASISSEATVRLFASLSLARLHPEFKSWAVAAEALGMPGPMGVRCARACSATMLVTADEWQARIRRVIEETPREDYRALEVKIRHRLGMRRWFEEWARRNRPGTRHGAHDLGLTWQWVHVAHAHLDLSPAWRGRTPTAKDRAPYRQFEASLDDKQRRGLTHALHQRA